MIGFDIDKTIQAAAYLIKRAPGQTENYMRMLKLLYIADRISLKERGAPISGAPSFAMKRGPVPGVILDLIKGNDPLSDKWDRYIKRVDWGVRLKDDPGNRNLSRAELSILDRVVEHFRLYDEWRMVRWCHKHLPEYKDNWKLRGNKKRHPIPLADVLKAIGRADDQQQIVAQVNANAHFDNLFGSHIPGGAS